MKLWNNDPRPRVGSCGKSNTSTALNPACASKRPAPDYAQRFAPTKANPSSNGWNAPSSGSRAADVTCRKVCWASPWIMRWASGRHWTFIWRTGGWRLDNNLVENAIRPTAIGKKNWLFMGDADAGERGAVIRVSGRC